MAKLQIFVGEKMPKAPLELGSCLLDNFGKEPNQIIKTEYRHDRWWYYIRSFEDGHLIIIPEGYIPYSYSVIDCPARKIPAPPSIKVGDTVEWGRGHTKGMVKAIKPDGEVEIETEKELYGVKGIAFPDIYELRIAKPIQPSEPVKGEQAGMLGVPSKVHTQKQPYEAGQMELESYTKYQEAMPSESDLHWKTIAELKQSCSQRGLPTDGKKEDLIRRLEKAKLIWKDVF